MLNKTLSLTAGAADNITFDLEDAVAPAQKPAARAALREHLPLLNPRQSQKPERAVRINAVSAAPQLNALADLEALAPVLPLLDAVVVPKVDRASDLVFVADVLRRLAPERQSGTFPLDPEGEGEGHEEDHGNSDDSSKIETARNNKRKKKKTREPLRLLALIESARAVMDLREICGALGPPGAPGNVLSGLVFAAEDFALDLSLTRTPSLTEFLYARSAVVTAARAARLPSAIDLVCTAYAGPEGQERLRAECRGGKGLGFNGKQVIHPAQLAEVQRVFAPSEAEVAWAVRVAIASAKAERAGRGAFTLDGSMIDAPVVGKANVVLDKAKRCGINFDGLMQEWKDLEPE